MATKRIKKWSITINGDLPVTWPLEAELSIPWTVDGLPEVPPDIVIAVDTIPSGTVTINQILTAAKALAVAALENDGTGGHTVEEGEP